MKKNPDGLRYDPDGQYPALPKPPFAPTKPGNHWQPDYFGEMKDATSSARITGHCGETMAIYLKIEADRVVEARFFTDGCRASAACGSLAVQLARGKDLDEVATIASDTLLEQLDWLPRDHEHCAQLAAEALQTAVHNYIVAGFKRSST